MTTEITRHACAAVYGRDVPHRNLIVRFCDEDHRALEGAFRYGCSLFKLQVCLCTRNLQLCPTQPAGMSR